MDDELIDSEVEIYASRGAGRDTKKPYTRPKPRQTVEVEIPAVPKPKTKPKRKEPTEEEWLDALDGVSRNVPEAQPDEEMTEVKPKIKREKKTFDYNIGNDILTRPANITIKQLLEIAPAARPELNKAIRESASTTKRVVFPDAEVNSIQNDEPKQEKFTSAYISA